METLLVILKVILVVGILAKAVDNQEAYEASKVQQQQLPTKPATDVKLYVKET